MLIGGGGIFKDHIRAGDDCPLRVFYHAGDAARGLGLRDNVKARANENNKNNDPGTVTGHSIPHMLANITPFYVAALSISNSYLGKPTCRMSSWKFGSDCKGSHIGSMRSVTRFGSTFEAPSYQLALNFARMASAASRSPSSVWT